jgi:hypothetical protein
MRAEAAVAESLAYIVLPDVRSGELVDLGSEPGVAIVTLIRHRF